MPGGRMSSVTIYHNPACGTSRTTLAAIRAAGVEPTIIEYLKTPPDRETLTGIAAAVGGPRALLREKGTPFAELGLGDPALGDEALIDAILAHPILMNRPVVITPKGTALCRPSERVLDLLDTPLAPDFVIRDGEGMAAR